MLSDLYAMGVTECDNMLMLVGVSTKMSEKERDVVMPLILRGFKVNRISSCKTWFLKLTTTFLLLGLCLGSWYQCYRWSDSNESMVHYWRCSIICLPNIRTHNVRNLKNKCII